MTMEFNEIKKVWDVQNNETMYVINEKALRNSIIKQKEKGIRITNITELVCIIVYLAAGVVDLFSGLFVLAAWMIIVGVYCLVWRIRRKMGENKFDRTMLGDLDHAIDIATYQVRFSTLMRWNIIPVCLFIVWGLWDKLDSVVLIIGVILFSVLTFFASNWEHNYYKRRKRQVVELRERLG